MQNPKETVTLYFKGVPIDKAKEIKEFAYKRIYLADEKNAVVYRLIDENPTVPLKELQKILRNKHKVQKTLRKIKLIATDCGLPYTE